MSDRDDDGEGFNDETSYRVGYGHPPKGSQFKPGKSGNPNGRPKGSKEPGVKLTKRDSLAKLILKLARRKIKVNDAGGEVEMATAEAILTSLSIKALKGDVRAQSKFLNMVSMTEAVDAQKREKGFQIAFEYKDQKEDEIKQRKAAGVDDSSDIVPHPDHIVIDVWAGTAELIGPFTQKEKVDWNRWKKFRDEYEPTLPEFDTELAEETDPKLREEIIREREEVKAICDFATLVWSMRRCLLTGEVILLSAKSKRASRK